MTPSALRPLAIGEVLDQAFGLYRRLFGVLVVVQLVCASLPFLFNLYVTSDNSASLGSVLISYLLSFVAGALASAAAALAISERYLGREMSAGDALRRALPKVGPLLLLSLAIGLVVMLSALPLGLVAGVGAAGVATAARHGVAVGATSAVVLVAAGLALLVVPMAVFTGFSVSTPSLVLEPGVTPTGAMSRSWFLTKGYRLRIIGLLLVFGVILAIPIMGLSAVAGLVVHGENPAAVSRVFVAALTGLISFIITPLLYCLITLLYYDLRVRKEAFDLEMLAASLQPA
jgi:hypothetical protein